MVISDTIYTTSMKSNIKKPYLIYLKASIYLDKSLTLSKVKLSSLYILKPVV